MAGIADALLRHAIAGIDTSLFIYELEIVEPFAAPARAVFRSVQQGSVAGVNAPGIRARAGLSGIDALQVATSAVAGATAFLTNDNELRRVGDLEILVLSDYLES